MQRSPKAAFDCALYTCATWDEHYSNPLGPPHIKDYSQSEWMLFLASIMLTSLLFLPAAAQMKSNHSVDIALDKPITNIVLPTIHGNISKFQDDFPEMSYGDYLVEEMGGHFIYSEGHWYLATSTKQKVAQISDQYMDLVVQDAEGGIPSFGADQRVKRAGTISHRR